MSLPIVMDARDYSLADIEQAYLMANRSDAYRLNPELGACVTQLLGFWYDLDDQARNNLVQYLKPYLNQNIH